MSLIHELSDELIREIDDRLEVLLEGEDAAYWAEFPAQKWNRRDVLKEFMQDIDNPSLRADFSTAVVHELQDIQVRLNMVRVVDPAIEVWTSHGKLTIAARTDFTRKGIRYEFQTWDPLNRLPEAL